VRTWRGSHWLLRHLFHHRSDPNGYVIVTDEEKNKSDNASPTLAVESHPLFDSGSRLHPYGVQDADGEVEQTSRHRSDTRMNPYGDRARAVDRGWHVELGSSWWRASGHRSRRLEQDVEVSEVRFCFLACSVPGKDQNRQVATAPNGF
jgi:hypothetical protein